MYKLRPIGELKHHGIQNPSFTYMIMLLQLNEIARNNLKRGTKSRIVYRAFLKRNSPAA